MRRTLTPEASAWWALALQSPPDLHAPNSTARADLRVQIVLTVKIGQVVVRVSDLHNPRLAENNATSDVPEQPLRDVAPERPDKEWKWMQRVTHEKSAVRASISASLDAQGGGGGGSTFGARDSGAQ